MDINWAQTFIPQVSLLEIFIRGSIIYLTIFFFFRFISIRVGGSLSIGDVLVIVLIADAAQNGMAGGYKSVTEGIFLVGTIIFWNFIIEYLKFYSLPFRRFLTSEPLLVIKDGQMQPKNMRRQLLSEDELMSKIREKGILDISSVKAAYIEDDGQLSFIEKEDPYL